MSSIEVEVGRISRIVLNRPDKHNAMTEEMGRLIADAVERINAHDAARVVLISGAGRAFCAGGDFSLIEDSSKRAAEENQRNMVAFYGTFLSVLRLRVPSVAVIHGAAVGAGLCLALAADVRLAGTSARFDTRFLQLGIHPGGGHTWMLRRIVGPQVASAMVLFGEVLSGPEAAECGLAWRCVEDDDLIDAAMTLARRAAAAPPELVRRTKATIAAVATIDDHPAAVERELVDQAWSVSQPAFAQRLAAMAAKISKAPGR